MITAGFGIRVVLFTAPIVAVLGCQALLGDFEVTEAFESTELGIACAPNSFRCDGRDLQICRDNRAGFEQYLSCETPDHCDPTAGACRPCTPGEWACNGKTLARCSADARWEVMMPDCLSPELCVVSVNRTMGACAAAVCTPAGSLACQGTHLLRCSDAQNELTPVEDCKDAALCNPAASAENGAPHCAGAVCGDACPAPTCDEPGTVRCATSDFGAIELCGSDHQWTIREACKHRALCSSTYGRCLPAACAPGERRCLGQVREECSADLTRFEGVETCAASAVCEPDRCNPTPCTEGMTRCNGVSFERCVDGTFRPDDRCATTVLCDPVGGCADPSCGGLTPNPQFVCNGSTLSRCAEGRDGYEDFTCRVGEVCDDVTGSCQMP